MQKQLNAKQQELVARLKSIDAAWIEGPSHNGDIFRQLEDLYRLFSYYSRWESQIQERIVQIAI